MNQLSPGELYELILLGEASIDAQFQLWLTCTFATIVASFAARSLLTKKMRWIVAALYLLVTFVYVSRLYYDGVVIFAHRDALSQLGLEHPSVFVTGVGRVVTMFFGTLATLYFIYLDPQSDPD
jgi:hypothetical protein